MITVRISFEKKNEASYISLLDLQRVMQRVLKRSGLPVWHTLGFNPHIYMTFACPLSLGQESECECVDVKTEAEAPDFAQWQFSAPTCMLVPSHRESAVSRFVYGTHRTTSQAASFTRGFSSVISFFAALRSLFIFQFPAMIFFLAMVLSPFLCSWNTLFFISLYR